MSREQNEHSIAKIIYHSLTRKKQPLNAFSPTIIRVNNIYCKASQLQKFTKAFCHPNELPSFAFVATFKLVLQCLSQSNVPSKLLGLIHLSSDFQIAKAHNWLLPMDVEVAIKDVTQDEKGICYLIVTKLYQSGEVTIINTNRMLDKDRSYRPNRAEEERKQVQGVGATIASTVLSLKTAWFYAFMSKDYNPIHLNNGLAKQLGLKRALIHGMFNVHFSLKHILKHRDDAPDSIKVQFNKPCFLPNQVFLKQYNDGNSYGLFGRDKTERFVKIELGFNENEQA